MCASSHHATFRIRRESRRIAQSGWRETERRESERTAPVCFSARHRRESRTLLPSCKPACWTSTGSRRGMLVAILWSTLCLGVQGAITAFRVYFISSALHHRLPIHVDQVVVVHPDPGPRPRYSSASRLRRTVTEAHCYSSSAAVAAISCSHALRFCLEGAGNETGFRGSYSTSRRTRIIFSPGRRWISYPGMLSSRRPTTPFRPALRLWVL